MAKSGSYRTPAFQGRCLEFTWSIKSQSVDTCQTVIDYTLKGAGDASASWYMTGPVALSIDNQTVYSRSTRFKLYKGTVITSGTYTLTHNSEGKKRLVSRTEAAIYESTINSELNYGCDLPDIPRASTPSIITHPSTTQSIGYLGSTVDIYTNRGSDKYTHTIGYTCGDTTETIATDVTDKCNWTIPESLIYKADSNGIVAGAIECKTYKDAELLGTKSVAFEATVENTEDTRPDVTVTVQPDNNFGTSALSNVYIVGRSKVSVAISATAKYGASIRGYRTVIEGKAYSGAQVTSDALNSAGTKNIEITAVDSRSIATTVNVEIDVRNYDKPYVTNADNRSEVMCFRAVPDGTAKNDSQSVKLIAKRKYYPLLVDGTACNSCKMRWRCKNATSDLWGGWTELTISQGDTFEGFLEHTFSVSQSYTVEVGVIDDIGEASSIKFDIPSDEVNLHLGDGLCVGIGCYANKSIPRSVTIGDDWSFFRRDGSGLSFMPDDLSDYVISRTVEDGWDVIRWKSGFKECRKNVDYSNINTHVQYGSLYRTNSQYHVDYPEGLFSQAPALIKSISQATAIVLFTDTDCDGTNIRTPDFGFYTASEAVVSRITVHLYASGY